ncbi:cysteine hydrolase family protein [Actinacidiphila rubida]|uniref:Nicotinamidase-related amidase n=1 Tax=Actinacidiphila rubida TaxID=310780 RepID=A0A1H8PXY9_9ACTN|nr:isochorismatase family cysteine hydrolase [Actinacidiphila rubida]SEO46805.1 Nicotinamidase-related amidase [Actinacidiphila rubida]
MAEQLRYDTGTTGLVLIDLLNEFLADDGKLNARIAEMVRSQDLVSQLGRLIAGARVAGVPIIYAPHGLDEHSFDDITYLHPSFTRALENKAFWKGTTGADFYPPLRPQAGETVLTQHRMYDSFIGTDLQEQLHAQGIQKIVFAGLTSSACIEGTGRHALEAGYHVTFVADAVADFTQEEHRAAVDLAYPVYGHETVTVDQFLAAVGPA